ncbi:MAG: hypothetical protein WCG34_09420 [Leptolinea sp.]
MFKSNLDHLILLTAVILYSPFLFLGYGSDMDTYNVLEAGRNFARTLDYVPSRGPGFFVFETITYILDQIGGSLLTNLTIMGMALIILYGFMRLCREYDIPNYRILTLALMVHAFFWYNATTTMDFLMALGFTFLGIIQVRRGHYFTAGASFALGAGSRLTSVLFAGGFLLWQFIIEPGNRMKLLQTGLVFGVFTLVFYMPPADFAQWTTRFLVASVGGEEYWSPLLRVGRFAYKNLLFWSIPVALLLGFIIIQGIIRTRWTFFSKHRGLPLVAALTILLYEAFYFSIPTEPSYLIPTIPLWLIVFGAAAGEPSERSEQSERKWPSIALAASLLVTGIVTLNIARPDMQNRATAAEYGLWVEPGHLVKETRIRINYQKCGHPACNAVHKPAPTR